jgi:hypothetical protein
MKMVLSCQSELFYENVYKIRAGRIALDELAS